MIATKFFSFALLASSAAAQNVSLRYMPLGDSITEATCWRALLWEMLQSTEFASVDWVGSGTFDFICGDMKYDRNNEGHSGYLATGIANLNLLTGWLKSNPADVITMHLGTNDIAYNRPTEEILAAFTTLVGVMRASNPRMKIIVAQIIPSTLPNLIPGIQSLNNAIPVWALGLTTLESPIWVVNQNKWFTGSDLRDGVHPNLAGDAKMANIWFPALSQALYYAKLDKLWGTA
ncbi:carbohydrate esterase family 3 protein [Xylariaceae sp. FL1651]|nr:carbohydrate esterase family 3 protein [Xylariaceae sp. FL1651]